MGGETLRSTMGLQDHQTHPRSETLFLLAYRMEAIIQVDISMPMLRAEGAVPDQSNTLLRLMLDYSEER